MSTKDITDTEMSGTKRSYSKSRDSKKSNTKMSGTKMSVFMMNYSKTRDSKKIDFSDMATSVSRRMAAMRISSAHSVDDNPMGLDSTSDSPPTQNTIDNSPTQNTIGTPTQTAVNQTPEEVIDLAEDPSLPPSLSDMLRARGCALEKLKTAAEEQALANILTDLSFMEEDQDLWGDLSEESASQTFSEQNNDSDNSSELSHGETEAIRVFDKALGSTSAVASTQSNKRKRAFIMDIDDPEELPAKSPRKHYLTGSKPLEPFNGEGLQTWVECEHCGTPQTFDEQSQAYFNCENDCMGF